MNKRKFVEILVEEGIREHLAEKIWYSRPTSIPLKDVTVKRTREKAKEIYSTYPEARA